MRRDFGVFCLLLALLDASLAAPAFALTTAFTYQGQLQQAGAPANGTCDFQFSLWDALGSGAPPTGGSQIGSTQTKSAVNISNGVFTVPLDFGASAFSSASDRWLHIAVRCPAGSGSYQALAPRQPLTPAPFALFASTIADGSVSSAKLASGAVTTSQLGTNAVTAAQIADGTITANDLANGAVSTAKIGDAQVTSAKVVVPLRLTSSVANTRIGAFDGTSTGSNGVGVSGTANSGANSAGVFGKSTIGTGVLGEGGAFGVKGTSAELGGTGVHGIATGDGMPSGVVGEGPNGFGVSGIGGIGGVAGTGAWGIYGVTLATSGIGVYGTSSFAANDANAVGVQGGAKKGVGVRGESDSGLAGLFVGPVQVTSNLIVNGAVFAAVKSFKIDHPLDPANKYLMHASVESPEMKNLYDGVVVLDANGEARVELPEWFEALNRDFRYQLTCIGGFAPVYVADEVSGGHFRIAGGNPGMKVSWLVTGMRKDAFAVAHPLAVEAEKTAEERGRYLHPVEMGMPASLSVDRTQGAALQ